MRLYPDTDFISAEETMEEGKKKSRIRQRGEVIEGLTTLLLDNWEYVSDSMKHDMELFLSYAVYMVNKIAEKTHEPEYLERKPKTIVYEMRIMILLDCINRLEQLNASRNIKVYKPFYSTYGEDEIGYIRSKLKPPKSEWKRGDYDWKEKGSCWVVTAYYGSPFDPNVQSIKNLRSSLQAEPVVGTVVTQVNFFYHRVGQSAFGHWWQAKLSESHDNLPKYLSGMVCHFLLSMSRLSR
jgi:hypothetical protein